ncbi:hypothetical protein [Pandoraea bronchicola]|uniref:Transmembrane protein n=1 Tax=Pandoraea bronchicola TaxID=2508287 RepID=A0A5E5BT85_9BURK|nr:hypothetical protein [Pandoraea bronchicola]VVE88362.1 hypothetical protein PBR20603_02311 [Pandoraea bronchicola]
MPVDFNRVPARKPVPKQASLSVVTAIILLVAMLCIGAGLTMTLWPDGSSTDAISFWACALGLSVATWAVTCCSRLGYADVKRSSVIAHNRACDDVELACHAAASVPLAVLGHAWCFSSEPTENQSTSVFDGTVKAAVRPSAAQADLEVNARWIDIPGHPYGAGNEGNELARHRVLIAWLYGQLLERIVGALRALPANSRLDVAAHVSSSVKLEWATERLEEHIRALRSDLELSVTPFREGIPLFQIDSWLDEATSPSAKLIVSLHLVNAISQALSDGAAEAGVAILFGPGQVKPRAPALLVHRPAAGTLQEAATVIPLAARWGACDPETPASVLTHGVTQSQKTVINQQCFPNPVEWHSMEDSVGNSAATGPWLALALAMESTGAGAPPQLVLCTDNDKLVASVCREHV